MHSIIIPFIALLENMSFAEFNLAMEYGAAKLTVNQVNWPSAWPYQPSCTVEAARSDTHLALLFHVRGLDLRATALSDNGRSWEDSCCEFFMEAPDGESYFNFELTCIGSLLAAKGPDRHDRTQIPAEELRRVIRHSSLPFGEIQESGGIHEWTVAMLIPFDLVGIDPEHLPETIRCNFYKCGDRTAHPHFVSWSPIDTPSPDFHRPEFFGEIHLR